MRLPFLGSLTYHSRPFLLLYFTNSPSRICPLFQLQLLDTTASRLMVCMVYRVFIHSFTPFYRPYYRYSFDAGIAHSTVYMSFALN